MCNAYQSVLWCNATISTFQNTLGDSKVKHLLNICEPKASTDANENQATCEKFHASKLQLHVSDPSAASRAYCISQVPLPSIP
mmetsp:Transcript_32713/g.60083  ORF Transcript_32713/g.60083 Transcript_32713/m.60083 type:complete len:83 (-) Transcript_32713:1616-1864(-)